MKYKTHLTVGFKKGTMEAHTFEGYPSTHHALMTRLDDVFSEMKAGGVKSIPAFSAVITPVDTVSAVVV